MLDINYLAHQYIVDEITSIWLFKVNNLYILTICTSFIPSKFKQVKVLIISKNVLTFPRP